MTVSEAPSHGGPNSLEEDRSVQRQILRILKRHERRRNKETSEEELSDAIDLPWRSFMDQLEVLEREGLIRKWFPARTKFGRLVRITARGRRYLSRRLDHSKLPPGFARP